MSVTFSVSTIEVDWENPTTFVNLANENAEDVLAWIGIPYTPGNVYGELPASEFVAKCNRRLWDTRNATDPAVTPSNTQRPGQARLTTFGRRSGYLHERTYALLALAELAGAGATIRWS